MKRRTFLKSSLALAGASAAISDEPASAREIDAKPRQFYELRLYHLRRGPQTDLFDKFYRDAALPALNRAGIPRWACSAWRWGRIARPCMSCCPILRWNR